jgi:hypothetical protein
MATEKILNENWDDYDNKKIRDNRDARFFACTESWEVDYLVKKIKKLYLNLSEEQIRVAIKSCCLSILAPHPRRTFVKCVVDKLGLI